jgi:hypothetical protein
LIIIVDDEVEVVYQKFLGGGGKLRFGEGAQTSASFITGRREAVEDEVLVVAIGLSGNFVDGTVEDDRESVTCWSRGDFAAETAESFVVGFSDFGVVATPGGEGVLDEAVTPLFTSLALGDLLR